MADLALYKIRMIPKGEETQVEGVSMIDLFVFAESLESAMMVVWNDPKFQHTGGWMRSWWCIWPTDPEGIRPPSGLSS